jgi:hypothetical protein
MLRDDDVEAAVPSRRRPAARPDGARNTDSYVRWVSTMRCARISTVISSGLSV